MKCIDSPSERMREIFVTGMVGGREREGVEGEERMQGWHSICAINKQRLVMS